MSEKSKKPLWQRLIFAVIILIVGLALMPFLRACTITLLAVPFIANESFKEAQQSQQAPPSASPTAGSTVKPEVSKTVCGKYTVNTTLVFGEIYCLVFSIGQVLEDDEYYWLRSSDGSDLGIIPVVAMSNYLDQQIRMMQPGCQVEIVGNAVPHPSNSQYVIVRVDSIIVQSCPTVIQPTSTETYHPKQGKCLDGYYEIKTTGGYSYCVPIDNSPENDNNRDRP